MLLKSKKVLLKFCWQFLAKQSSGLDFVLGYGIAVCMSSCQEFMSVFCFVMYKASLLYAWQATKRKCIRGVTQCINKW